MQAAFHKVLLVFVFVALFVSFSQADDENILGYLNTEYESPTELKVAVHSETVILSGTLPRTTQDRLAVAELSPDASSTSSDLSRKVCDLEADSNGQFRVTLPRFSASDEVVHDRGLSRFAIVTAESQSRKRVSPWTWATLEPQAALYADQEPSPEVSIKGLGGIHPDPRLFDDLVDLGVRQITVNISLPRLIAMEAGATISHSWNDKTFYFHQQPVEQLDRLLSFAQEHGIIATAIILIPRSDRQTEKGRRLTHPDAIDGHYCLANVVTPEGVESYAAAMRFLAERYGKTQGEYGKLTHWIIHNEVDAAWVWTNAGEKTATEFMEQYVRSLRIALFAVHCFDPHAKVFITLTHHWTEPHQPNPKRFYSSRDLLEQLARWSAVEGDFDWGVAYHPYPQSLFHPKTWLDKKAKDNFDTPQITFKNIEVLDRFLQQDVFLDSRGHVRDLLLSEQGFHSKDNSTEAQLEQAAALAYAWKKMEGLTSIKAFHYHRWIDHEREGGLNLGLWTVKPGSITWPAEKKKSWYVFQALDTDKEREAFEFALPIIGIKTWADLP